MVVTCTKSRRVILRTFRRIGDLRGSQRGTEDTAYGKPPSEPDQSLYLGLPALWAPFVLVGDGGTP